jgi:hypothetical protein
MDVVTLGAEDNAMRSDQIRPSIPRAWFAGLGLVYESMRGRRHGDQ